MAGPFSVTRIYLGRTLIRLLGTEHTFDLMDGGGFTSSFLVWRWRGHVLALAAGELV